MTRIAIMAAAVVAALALQSCASFQDPPSTVAPTVVKNALETIKRFKSAENLASFAKHIPGARAVVVLPTVIKAGFIGGGESGNGVLLARRDDGSWGYPAFYTLGAASFGLQAGIQDTEVVLVVRSDKALNAIIEHQGKFGADLGLTVGVIGVGMEASTTTNFGADILAFANAKVGIFGGASIEAGALVRRKDLNEAYYAAGAKPRAIIFGKKYSNAGADPLRAALDIR